MLNNPGGSEILTTLIAALSLVLVVALPLLPAILIYKIFPDEKISTKGTLGAFTWNATGAFAGYIVVLILITTTQLKEVISAIGVSKNPAWIVEMDIHGYSAENEQKVFSDLLVSLNPSMHRVASNKVILRIPGLSKIDWPTVQISIPSGRGKTDVNLAGLSDDEIEIDGLSKRVRIISPVVVREVFTADDPYPSVGIGYKE